MVGPHLLVAPIVEEGATERKAVFPRSSAFFNLFDGSELERVEDQEVVTVKASLE